MISTVVPSGMRRSLAKALIITGALILCMGLGLAIRFAYVYAQRINTHFSSYQQRTETTAQLIGSFITKHDPEVSALAKNISSHTLDTAAINELLQKKPNDLSGLGFIDYKNSSVAYYLELDGEQTLKNLSVTPEKLEAFKKITAPTSALLKDPISNQQMLYFVAPIMKNTTLVGAVFSAQSMAHIRHILSSLFLGQKGYWLLTNNQGTILIHPFASWSKDQKNISMIGQSVAQTIQSALEKQTTQHLTYDNEITANRSWLFATPIAKTGLMLAGVFDTNEVPIPAVFYRQSFMMIIVTVLCAVLLLILGFILLQLSLTPRLLWFSSMIASILMLLSIAASWIVAHKYPDYPEQNTPIISKSHLYTLLDSYSGKTQMAKLLKPQKELSDLDTQEFSRVLNYRYKTGKYVPTGFLINDIQMKSQDTVEFVAYIWQRYFDGIHDGVSRGFLLPQIADKPTIQEISRSKLEKAETIIWQVRCELNQKFSYQKYPFDVKNIDFQIRHKDFDKHIILVPDLDAYTVLNPTALPAVGKDAELINWQLLKSYFSFHLEQFNTNFGLYAYGPFGIYDEVTLDHVPELHLNVISQRYLVDTLISDLLPPCVIAVILFVLLLTYFAEGTFELLLETSAAAFFSTVFAQVQFRSKIPSHEFVYFELFYFTLYILILLILCTTLIHMFKIRVPIINYRNNMVTKLLYWPLLFTIILVATIHYLY